MKQQVSRKEKQLHKILSEMDPAAVHRLLNIFLILKELQLLYFVSVDNTRKEIT